MNRSGLVRGVGGLIAAAGLALGCSNGSEPNTAGGGTPPPSPFVISSPVPVPASVAAGVARSGSSGATVVYVSLPPGAIPGGRTASIVDGRAGSSASTVMVDGGFDPVPVSANVGDTLAITVQVSGAGAPVSYTMAVPEGSPPIVVRTSPPPHKRDVPLNASMVVVFSQPLDPATVGTASVKLWRGFTAVPGTVRFADAADLRAEFHPDTPLAENTDYQFVVSQSIRGANGLPLHSAVAVPFTTGSTQPPADLVFASVSVGNQHSCGVTTTGGAYCWGSGSAGQLGDGSTTNSLTPVAVAGGLTFASISASALGTCGIATNGAAYCWGVGNHDWSATPIPVAAGLTFATMSNGENGSCVVTVAGAAYCWGGNQATPVPVAGGLTFAMVSVGSSHTCGVTTVGAAYCWGQNSLGELGIGTSTGPDQCQEGATSYSCSFSPVAVAGGLAFTTVSAGRYGTCGLTTSGVAYCWGNNRFGLLGYNPASGPEWCELIFDWDWVTGPIPCSRAPLPVPGGINLASLSTSMEDVGACGLRSTGVALCWGEMRAGGESDGKSTPVVVAGGLTFATLSTGAIATCGVTSGGVAYCWGANSDGQLGNGTTTYSDVPVKVAGQP